MLATANKIKNKILKPVDPEYWKQDQAWSYFQYSGSTGLSILFLILFAVANIVLFGGVYWSKFAHMFYKPGAAIQKNLAEADGSRDNLPPPADAPEQFGLGIKREAPKHY